MNFYGKSFIYDNISSDLYDLRILNFSQTSPSEGSIAGNVNIKEEWIYRREVPYFYGTYYENSLEFDLVVGSFSYIDGNSRDVISRWLYGKQTYTPLKIVQDDISTIVFNVIFTQISTVYIANVNYALRLHAKCDRPWAYYIPPVLNRNYAPVSNTGLLETISYYNSSSFSGYNKPVVSFTIDASASSNGRFSIINRTDDPSGIRPFTFTGLDGSETITVDNDRGIITSSVSGALRMNVFSKNFLRLVQGLNSIELYGLATNFTLSTKFARLVGD